MLTGERFTAAAQARRQWLVAQRTRLPTKHLAGAAFVERGVPTRWTGAKMPLDLRTLRRGERVVNV